jgi:hypothetical protein
LAAPPVGLGFVARLAEAGLAVGVLFCCFPVGEVFGPIDDDYEGADLGAVQREVGEGCGGHWGVYWGVAAWRRKQREAMDGNYEDMLQQRQEREYPERRELDRPGLESGK